MTEEQIEIGNKLLELYFINNGQLNDKEWTSHFNNKNDLNKQRKINTIITIMIEDYELLRRHPKLLDYKTITKNGLKAYEIGLKKFIQEFEEKEKLELENLKSNIKTAKRSQTISIFALAISAIAPVLAVLIGVYINKENNIDSTINKHPEYYKQNIPICQDSISCNIIIKDSINVFKQ